MQLDKTTISDLSFGNNVGSAFELIDRCITQAGTRILRQHIQAPPATYERLLAQQDAVRFWIHNLAQWPSSVSNGTLVMLEQFYESVEAGTYKPNPFLLRLEVLTQQLFNKNQYSFIRFSVAHLIDFLKGCEDLVALQDEDIPVMISADLELMKSVLRLPLCQSLIRTGAEAPQAQILLLSYHARRELKRQVYQLMACYARQDALQSMARATVEHGWTLPVLLPADQLHYHAVQLYHPLLKQPVPHNIDFTKDQNFLFLTGANMSGKSTLIRTTGVGALLAHVGMGVPAESMKISFLEGIITNMQVEDNILLGESYFFAEVQRMKLTAKKLSRNRYHLVLMDELFKGTNVHDAYECSRAVIQGLLQQKDNLMALSTHLNELADGLMEQKGMWFRYCYTKITDNGDYAFTYQLKEGVSKDRIGYLVLQKEGVLDLLKGDSRPS